jgi:hypothetical protein
MIRPISPFRAYCTICPRKLDVMAADEKDAVDEAVRKGWDHDLHHDLLCTVCIANYRALPPHLMKEKTR